MSNFSSEVNSEEPDPNRTVNIPKKKSGFQITSVTDSGHGRPLSIVRDGEESADDLDESHASYSDVSYSRATDADHDQESTASEDTLNISVHESTNVTHADGVINHVGAIHHTHTHHDAGFASKVKLQKDTTLELKKSHHILPLSISKNNLSKENSEHLDSPQELPHDNNSGETVPVLREKKSEDPSKRVDPSGTSVKVATPQSASSEQSPLNTTSTVLSSNISSIVTTQSSTSNASTYFVETAWSETIPMAAASSVVTTTTATKPTVIPGVKVAGTRVYKVVKRDSAQPTKRVRGRWNWYDFSDTQAPMTGITQSGEEIRMASSGPVHTFTYTNPLMSPTVMPYTLQQSGSASTLKDDLLSAGLSSTSDIGQLKASASHRQVIGLAADALKTAIKGDAATGDTNGSGRTLKIDNKIEAAMDLVKKHLMSAVRDEVDELKEKIKDLTEETTRLKSENEELRAALPTEVASHVDGSLSPPKESSSTEDHQNDDNSSRMNKVSNEGGLLNHTLQKGMNVSMPQDGSKPPLVSMPQDGSKPLLSSAHPTDPKTKLAGSNAPQHSVHLSQRQDVQMTVTTKTTSLVGGQPVVTAQVHMQMSQTPGQNTQQNVDPQIMHEQGTKDIVKTNAKRNDPNFDKKNPP